MAYIFVQVYGISIFLNETFLSSYTLNFTQMQHNLWDMQIYTTIGRLEHHTLSFGGELKASLTVLAGADGVQQISSLVYSVLWYNNFRTLDILGVANDSNPARLLNRIT